MTFSTSFSRPFVQSMSQHFSAARQPVGPALYAPAFWLNKMGQSNKAPTNTRTSVASVYDYDDVLNICEAGEIILEGGRREQTLTSTLTTHSITVAENRSYQVSCEGDSGATVTLSNAATGVLTNDGTNRIAFDAAKKAATTTLTLTISGTLTHIQVQDVTGRSNIAPSEKLDINTDYGCGADGVRWYATELGNTISSGVVTEDTGSAITPAPQVLMQPPRSNPIVNNLFTELDSGSNTFENWLQSVSGSSTLTQELDDVPAGFSSAAKITVDGSNNAVSLIKLDYLTSVTSGYAVMSMEVKAGAANGLKFIVKCDDGSGGDVQFLSLDGSSWQDGAAEFVPTNLPTSWERWTMALPQLNVGRNRVWIFYITRNGGAGLVHFLTSVQLEEGQFATTPIKNTTAASTRDADKIEIDSWDGIVDVDEGVALYRMALKVDLADTGGSYVRGGSADNQLIKGYTSGSGLEAYDGTNTSLVTSGGLAGEEIQVGVAWSSTYNKLVIGYYEPTTDTFTWGSEQAFSGWTSGGSLKLGLGQDIESAYTISKLEIYKGLPPESSSFSDVKTWVEANR
jgi:hypothetical protein